MTKVDVKARDKFAAFMTARGLKPHPWAKKAGLRSSTLYNFLAGKSHNLSAESLQKLAKAANATVDEILGGKAAVPTTSTVAVTHSVGVFGRLYEMEKAGAVPRPIAVPEGLDAVAARIDGDGLHPIPAGWHVFYEKAARDPGTLINKMAVVKVSGQGHQLIREIRRGTTPGLYTLLGWNASPLEDVEIVEAHLIVGIMQS